LLSLDPSSLYITGATSSFLSLSLSSKMERNVTYLLIVSCLLRLAFFSYGIYQDSHFKVKYTDIDYHVFNDAGHYVFNGMSPYLRETYRYTPLLSWLFTINHYFNNFHLSKLIFVVFDVLTGVVILHLLPSKLPTTKKIKLASLWLLNPMVITISTRGNAETILCFLIMLTILTLKNKQFLISSLLFGLCIHFKIYPIIYALPITIYLFYSLKENKYVIIFNYGLMTLVTIIILNVLMFHMYGFEFLDQTYLYHIYRFDHRHNFSIWNQLLYLDSALTTASNNNISSSLSKYAFIPQIGMVILIGLYNLWIPDFKTITKKRARHLRVLCNVLFIQTFAFVTFNKVCTSQYFIWYLIFLPFYCEGSQLSLLRLCTMLAIWIGSQAAWLNEGYKLEFLGKNVFYPGLFIGNVIFFLGNSWILGQFISDLRSRHYASKKAKTLSHREAVSKQQPHTTS